MKKFTPMHHLLHLRGLFLFYMAKGWYESAQIVADELLLVDNG